jgi:CNT family concentrative nucleoside transporter
LIESFLDIIRPILGISIFIGITLLISSDRKSVSKSLIVKAIGLQAVLCLTVLKVPGVLDVFEWISNGFVSVAQFANFGADFLFGSLSADIDSYGFIFVFRVIPPIIFFSALSSLLYYLGILQKIVNLLARVLEKVLGISGAESLAAAANVFLGHTEAPLLVKPYLSKMTDSEIFSLVVGGLATISGAVLVACVSILGQSDPERLQYFATQFLTASIISAPAAIMFAKIIFPSNDNTAFSDEVIEPESKHVNAFDALASGTFDGTKLAVNVAVMLLVFVSLIALINTGLTASIGEWTGLNTAIGGEGLTMQYILGWVFAPVSWLMGVSSEAVLSAGQLIGEKTVANEILAYQSMSAMINDGVLTADRDIAILTYGLCGFANFGSIGIMIGAMNALAPNKKGFVAKYAIKALIAGSFASFSTGCIAGIIV